MTSTPTGPGPAAPVDLMTTNQVAKYLGVRAGSVARWHRAGVLPSASKLPGRTGALLFDARDVERLAHDRAAGDALTHPVPAATVTVATPTSRRPAPDSWVCPECRVRVVGGVQALRGHQAKHHERAS